MFELCRSNWNFLSLKLIPTERVSVLDFNLGIKILDDTSSRKNKRSPPPLPLWSCLHGALKPLIKNQTVGNESSIFVSEMRSKLCQSCVYIQPFNVKASSHWISWGAREQVNDVLIKTLLSSAKSLHRYFRMKHQTVLTSHFFLFTH